MKKVLSTILALIVAVSSLAVCSTAFAADLSSGAIIMDATEYEYTGAPIEPAITVNAANDMAEYVTITKDVDYAATYANNVTVGQATVYVTGINAFVGALAKTYTIVPNKVTGLCRVQSTTNSITLAWNSLEGTGVVGYKVYSCDAYGNIIACVKTVYTNTATISKLSASTPYNYIVRAYGEQDGKKIYGNYSDMICTVTLPNSLVINSVTNAKDKKSITVKWKKIAASGIEIQYSKNKDFSGAVYSVVVDPSASSKKIKVDASKKYYVRMRAWAYGQNGYDLVYTDWSKKMSNSFNKVYSTYSSRYVNNKDRTTNLKLACKAINGTILQPGDTFSYNNVVGKRTAEKGYKKAYVFTGTQSHELGIGGGVCQVASTMFNAVLIANLPIVERHQHSQRVTYVPLGRDAAIYWGSENFKFTNNTEYPIKIEMKCENGKISCTLKVCEDVSPKKVKLNVSRKGNNFTLKRSVDGKVNYTTKSHY